MARENKTKYAILGVLSLMPASGYDIKKFCDNSINHFWNENYGHIYPVLKQLESDGWVEKKTEVNDGKLRNVYNITETGREKLVEWLELPPEVPQARYEYLLKTFFSKDIPVETSIKRLENSHELCSSLMEQYKGIEAKMKVCLKDEEQLEKGVLYWYMTVRYGILDMESKIQWCKESIDLLKMYSEKKQGGNDSEKHIDT